MAINRLKRAFGLLSPRKYNFCIWSQYQCLFSQNVYEQRYESKVQTRYLQNGAYARLKNIQLGYTFPTQIINKLHMQKLRVYVSAENVLTITSLPSGFDPETTYSSYSDGNSGKLIRYKQLEGGNLAASKIRNLECPSYEICLIDYGCGKFNRKYILWSNILDLRSRGINIARTARRLGVSRNTVRHLQSLSLEEVLQHKERHYKLHAYEQAVASLLTSFPPFPAAALATTCGNIIRTFRTSARRPSTIMSSSSGRSTIFLRPDNHRSHSPKEWEPGPSYT